MIRSIDRERLCSEHICSCDHCRLTIELIEWQTPYRLETIDGKSVEKPFELIEKLSGSIILKINKNLDREKTNFYQIRLIASDHGEPSRSNSTILNIEIEVR